MYNCNGWSLSKMPRYRRSFASQHGQQRHVKAVTSAYLWKLCSLS